MSVWGSGGRMRGSVALSGAGLCWGVVVRLMVGVWYGWGGRFIEVLSLGFHGKPLSWFWLRGLLYSNGYSPVPF